VSTEAAESDSPRITKDEVRLRAYQIYCARIARGQPGSEIDDWLQAEALLTTDYPCES